MNSNVVPSERFRRMRTRTLLVSLVASITAFGLARPPSAASQDVASVYQQDGTVLVAVGKAALVPHPYTLRRVSIANPEVAEVIVVSPTEVMVQGKAIGTTTLVMWDSEGGRVLRAVEVAVDAEALERHFRLLFPTESAIEVTSSGNTYILSGSVGNATSGRRAVEIAQSTGASVVDNMKVPAPHQVLLQVRFAEVSRSAMRQMSANLMRIDPFNLRGDDEGFVGTGQNTPPGNLFLDLDRGGPEQTFSDAVNLYLFNPSANVGVFIRALKAQGLFKSLAEPNLLARDGEEASFLAGGEFPFPVVQGSSANQAITIVFKEFGVRLNFTPTITNSGNIDLQIEPEVSTLDFGTGLQVSGFAIPTVLTRRAKTRVELRDGQTFAIAGLMDNSMSESVDKVPILGDIPVLGALFRSNDVRHDRSELMVLVTPRLVQPSATPPAIPTGEPETWDWDKSLEGPISHGAPGGTGER